MLRLGSGRIYSIKSVVDLSEKFSAAADRTRPISGATGGRCAAEPADRATRQAFPAAADRDDVRRCDDGSIDVEFYKARAYAIRRAVQVRFAQALTQLYQLAHWNGDFQGVPARKRESDQRRPIANRL
jgi:hypothetical protein